MVALLADGARLLRSAIAQLVLAQAVEAKIVSFEVLTSRFRGLPLVKSTSQHDEVVLAAEGTAAALVILLPGMQRTGLTFSTRLRLAGDGTPPRRLQRLESV